MEEARRSAPRPRGLGAVWRGEVPLATAFWWHAIVVGTAINVVATFAFVAVHAAHVSNVASLAVMLAPIPYNVFVAVAVWRSAGRYPGPPFHAQMARAAVVAWAIVASLV